MDGYLAISAALHMVRHHRHCALANLYATSGIPGSPKVATRVTHDYDDRGMRRHCRGACFVATDE